MNDLDKINKIIQIEDFKESFKKVLGKKLPQKIIEANMLAIQQAYDEVH